jgi:hypothetical protein
MPYTVNYAPQTGGIGLQGISVNSDVQKHPLGYRVFATDTGSAAYGNGEFIYLKGLANTAIGTVVTYNADDFSTALLAANAIGPVAVAMSACVANEFGWYQIYGKGVAKVLALFADNANCYATATGGSIDDAVVAGDLVKNMKGASAIDTPGTGLAEIEMAYPFMDDGLTA